MKKEKQMKSKFQRTLFLFFFSCLHSSFWLMLLFLLTSVTSSSWIFFFLVYNFSPTDEVFCCWSCSLFSGLELLLPSFLYLIDTSWVSSFLTERQRIQPTSLFLSFSFTAPPSPLVTITTSSRRCRRRQETREKSEREWDGGADYLWAQLVLTFVWEQRVKSEGNKDLKGKSWGERRRERRGWRWRWGSRMERTSSSAGGTLPFFQPHA